MDDKICPILLASAVLNLGGYCLEKKCAWWDTGSEGCCIGLLPQLVGLLGHSFGFIDEDEKPMPPLKQYTIKGKVTSVKEDKIEGE